MKDMYSFEDFKEKMTKYISTLKGDIQQLHNQLPKMDCCILTELEKIQQSFMKATSLASTYFLKLYLSPHTKEYETIAKAVKKLSELRHGGLIVIERTESIQPYLKNGIPIHATISSTLIQTIFYPGNPLHDGAIYIRGKEIVSAANILPLENDFSSPIHLGTRHRAAIGISKYTDAVALVVSEETGRISFTINGNIHPITVE